MYNNTVNTEWKKKGNSDRIVFMKNIFKNPKTRVRNLLIVIAPFLVVIILCGVIAYKSVNAVVDNTSGNSTVAYKKSIDSMDYHLRNNATELQESLFHDLQDAINSGDKYAIAEQVAKNFVADFYTWTNKEASYDVGGMYYVYSPLKTTMYKQFRDNYYKYLTYYINTYGSDKLLEVDSIEATRGDNVTSYEIDGNTYDAYFITVTWTYKNEDTFSDITIKEYNDSTDPDYVPTFCKKEYFTVIEKDDGRFEIVQAYGDN